MKIHKTLKRPWGFETPYTYEVDGVIYNGFLFDKKEPTKIDEQRVIDAVEEIRSTPEVSKEDRIAELVSAKEAIDRELEELQAKQ